MTPLEYCIDKAAPPGSTHDSAISRAKRANRAALLSLYAYHRELSDTVREVSDPSVAQTKINWWRHETAKLGTGAATHPVALALEQNVPSLSQSTHHATPLLDLLSAFEADLMQARYLDLPGLLQHLGAVQGDFVSLLADVVRPINAPARVMLPGEKEWAHQLGTALGLANIIADIGADARHGRIYLPISEMQRFDVTAADILNRRYSASFSALMQFQVARARTRLNEALAGIPRSEAKRQAASRAQAAMALRLLDEIERDDYQVLHQRIALTPLRQAWAAWRGSR